VVISQAVWPRGRVCLRYIGEGIFGSDEVKKAADIAEFRAHRDVARLRPRQTLKKKSENNDWISNGYGCC
jgi:hypothetical protein